MMLLLRPAFILAAAIAMAALSGCGALTKTFGGEPSSGPPSCATGACAASEITRSLTGTVAKDDSVFDKVSCKAATAKDTSGVWTMTCTVDYSDGSVWRGFGNWVTSSNQVTFEPEAQVES